ncbi:MAG: hypothetical protein D6806_05900 [Deltaproteobacteria bacterium]|nr:MAG: hypothetical protein D6806_05900 [Deltaproteobacteria bacterium]
MNWRLAVVIAGVFFVGMLSGCASVRGGAGREKTGSVAGRTISSFSVAAMTEAVFEVEAALSTPERLEQLNEQYSRMVEIDPKHPFKRFLWAYTLVDRNRAWSELAKITKMNSRFFWAYLGMGIILDSWKVFDQSEKNFRQAVEIAPRVAVGHALYGRMLLRAGRAKEAVERLERAVELDSSRAYYMLLLARARAAAGNTAGAEESYRKLLEKQPEHFEGLKELGLLLADAGKIDEAIEMLGKASTVKPAACDVRLKRAELIASKDAAKAIQPYKAACECLKKDKQCYKSLAAVAKRAGDDNALRLAWERIHELDPKDIEACRFLAPRYLEEKAIEKALPAYQRILEVEKDNIEALKGLALIFEQGGEYSRALQMVERLLALNPKNDVRDVIELKKRLFEKFHIIEPPVSGKSPSAVFGRVRKQIAAVYKTRLERKPSLAGDLLVKVTVDNEGNVTDVKLARDTLNDIIISNCAVWNLRRARFPRGFGATYDFALTLKPGG